MSNRIIVPANFTFEAIIKVDPVNGQSELMLRNKSGKPITMWQVAGLLITHGERLLTRLLTDGKVEQTVVDETPNKPNGGDHAA